MMSIFFLSTMVFSYKHKHKLKSKTLGNENVSILNFSAILYAHGNVTIQNVQVYLIILAICEPICEDPTCRTTC